MRRFYLLFLLSFVFACPSFSQLPDQTEQIRIQIWAELDEFPGKFEEEEKDTEENKKSFSERRDEQTEFQILYSQAIERARLIAPFLIEGMISGWNFEYTPYDRMRKVSEQFIFSPVRELEPNLNPLEYHDPFVKDNRLLTYVFCNRTPSQQAEFKRWESIVHPKIKGKGTGSVQDGFEGIKEACSSAVKNAVHEYWRTMIKNKPKEITGTVLLIKEPRIYIESGQYVVDLDFFLETDRIVTYTQY